MMSNHQTRTRRNAVEMLLRITLVALLAFILELPQAKSLEDVDLKNHGAALQKVFWEEQPLSNR